MATILCQSSFCEQFPRCYCPIGLMSPSDEPKVHEPSPSFDIDPFYVESIVQVRVISYQETCPLRQQVLRPDLDAVYYEGDLDPSSIHLGAFFRNELVGVISLFQEDIGEVHGGMESLSHLPTPTGNTQWRIRGFAVAAKMRSKGLGTKLISTCLECAKERGGMMVWCVARCSAEIVYKRQGFSTTGDKFTLDGIGHVCHMFRQV